MTADRVPLPLADVLREHPGLWIAIRNGTAVELAETAGLLVMRLKEREIRDATIVRSPRLGEPELVGLG